MKLSENMRDALWGAARNNRGYISDGLPTIHALHRRGLCEKELSYFQLGPTPFIGCGYKLTELGLEKAREIYNG